MRYVVSTILSPSLSVCQGLQLMKVGGKARLTIPASLGYGAKQMNSIPPNSELNFEVELLGATAGSKCAPWQCPSLAPVPLQGVPGGFGQLGTPRKKPAHLAPSHCLGCSS